MLLVSARASRCASPLTTRPCVRWAGPPRRHRNEVPRLRLPALDERGPPRRGPRRVRGLRERPGQRTPASEYPVKGRATLGVMADLRAWRRPGRRADRRRGRRGHGRHGEGQDRPVACRRGAPHQAQHDGRPVRQAGQGRRDRRRGPQRREGRRGRGRGAVAGDAETAKVTDGSAAAAADVDGVESAGLVDTADIAADSGPGDDVADGAPEDGTPSDDVPSDETFDDNAGGSE